MDTLARDEAKFGSCFGREDYVSPTVFDADRRLLATQWWCVDHVARFPTVGSYRVHRFCGESLIVVRDADRFRVMANVCRHRGSRICVEDEGRVERFVCPYHGWQYHLDGRLALARDLGFALDAQAHGLRQFAVEIYQGLIFVSLDVEKSAEFASVARNLEPLVPFHGLGRAAVARTRDYPFRANWKLVVENFLECFHCFSNHPELCSVYSHTKYTGGLDPTQAREFLVEAGQWERRAKGMGHPVGGVRSIDVHAHQYCVAFRLPIQTGFSSLSKSGAPLAPLMGEFRQYDGGETFGHVGPLFHFSLANDHAMLIRIAPVDAANTNVEVTWMVRGDAVPGTDYDAEAVSWLWDATVCQDRTAVERAYAGASSNYFVPGPYSELETETSRFARWYRERRRT
jgi:Rieske 2Fe-2S family protein